MPNFKHHAWAEAAMRTSQNTKRRRCCAAPLALLLGLLWALGRQIEADDGMIYSFENIVILSTRTIGLAVVLFVVLAGFLLFCDQAAPGRPQNRLLRWAAGHPCSFLLLLWAAFFLSFLPALLSYFPGIFSYDFPTQIRQVFSGAMSTHHPILHTLLCYGFLQIGRQGNDCTVGALCYCLFQMLCLSGAFAYTLAFLTKRKVPFFWLVICFLFFFLLPIHALFAINATKDVLFAAVFLPAFLFTVDLALEPIRFFHSPLLWLRYILAVTVMCLLRNTAIYLLLATCICAIFLFRGHRRPMAILSAVCIVAYGLASFSLTSCTHAEVGSVVEALALPLQQVARSYRDDRDAFTEDELQTLFSLVPEENLNRYSSRLADDVKDGVFWDAPQTNSFVHLWLKKLPMCFGSYLNGFFCMSEGFWYPGLNYPDSRTYHSYIETHIKPINGDFVITRSEKLPNVQTYYETIAGGAGPEDWPLVCLLFRPGAYAWVLFLLITVTVYQKKRPFALPLCMLVIFWGLLLPSPIALLRYAYPLMLALPAAAALVCTVPRSARNKEESECPDKLQF